MRSDVFHEKNTVGPPAGPGMTMQGTKAVRYVLNGEVLAKQGAMVAFRGNVQFDVKMQGMGNMFKRAVTGEGLKVMTCRGQGEVWFADAAANCFILSLDQGDAVTVNGRNVLCFDSSLRYEIKMVKGAGMMGGGLFNSVFTGQGQLAITTDGPPIVIPVAPGNPAFVDSDAVVCWSANLQTTVNRSQGMKALLKGGSGEMFQLRFDGDGFVMVQPSEGHPLQVG